MKSNPFILVVDDDPDDRESIQFCFSKVDPDANIQFLSSGPDLINFLLIAAPHQYPDLVILDYNMAVMNGGEALRQIKSNPFIEGIPVVIYSTTITPAMKEELQAAKALLCMQKSADVPKMIEQARYFLELL